METVVPHASVKPKNSEQIESKGGKGDHETSSGSDSESSEEEDPDTIMAEKKAANAKLKKDLEKESKEMAKVLMTNRQRKLYQKAEDQQQAKKETV